CRLRASVDQEVRHGAFDTGMGVGAEISLCALCRLWPNQPGFATPTYNRSSMEDLLQGVLRVALLEVAALFPIVNPVGTAPIFLSLTRGASAETRATLARRIAVNGFVLLVASMLVGSYILAFFGISLPVVQVAGG